MKTLPQKVKAVQQLYIKLDREIARFQEETGLHCLSGCGECCKKPDIEATPLEFLPLALHFFDNNKALDILESIKHQKNALCYVFRPHTTSFGGLCNEYPHRGLICRLFGYAARRNKEGQKELVTCKYIKSQQVDNYASAVKGIKQDLSIPIFSDYYTRLVSIDPSMAQFYPINEAMTKALETVLHYYAYRKRRKTKIVSITPQGSTTPPGDLPNSA